MALTYNPAMNEAEWVPACGLNNDLTQAEKRSTVALANYIPCIHKEVAQIVRLGACHAVSWPNDPSMLKEEEEEQDPEPPTMDTEPEQEEESEGETRQMDQEEEETNRQQHLWDWEAVMGQAERLAFDDL